MPYFQPRPPILLGVKLINNPEVGDDVDADQSPVPVSEAVVDCAVYCDGERLPGKFSYGAALDKVHDLEALGQQAFAWVGLHEPDEHQMQMVADVYQLHPLAVEDAVHAHQRPKVERYDDTLFLVIKTVNYVPHESVELAREIVETGEIMIFVSNDFVVTVRHGDHTGLAALRDHLEQEKRQLALGPFAVMHAISDHIVDSYRWVAAAMEADIDAVEEATFSPDTRTSIEPIYMLKREVVELRRAVSPFTEALTRINTDHQDLLSKEIRRQMRDVLDHQIHAADRISSYDEMLSSLVQAALARVGMQQNLDMRKISAWAAMAAVPTAIAGIYGMNFENMPELAWRWGYPAVLLLMLSICGFLYRTFHRNSWL